MNTVLWVIQTLAGLMYAASGVMKIFLFDKISADVPSFGALPRRGWTALGIVELMGVAGLVMPVVLSGTGFLVPVAAVILALESLVFIWVHVRYRETGAIVMSGALGLFMAFLAYGRLVLSPLG